MRAGRAGLEGRMEEAIFNPKSSDRKENTPLRSDNGVRCGR